MWPPLRGGLFGADDARAKAAMNKYAESFEKIKRQQF